MLTISKDIRRAPYGGGCFPLSGMHKYFFFAFLRGEVMWMEFTLEEVLMIISLVFVLLNYINNINKKK